MGAFGEGLGRTSVSEGRASPWHAVGLEESGPKAPSPRTLRGASPWCVGVTCKLLNSAVGLSLARVQEHSHPTPAPSGQAGRHHDHQNKNGQSVRTGSARPCRAALGVSQVAGDTRQRSSSRLLPAWEACGPSFLCCVSQRPLDPGCSRGSPWGTLLGTGGLVCNDHWPLGPAPHPPSILARRFGFLCKLRGLENAKLGQGSAGSTGGHPGTSGSVATLGLVLFLLKSLSKWNFSEGGGHFIFP